MRIERDREGHAPNSQQLSGRTTLGQDGGASENYFAFGTCKISVLFATLLRVAKWLLCWQQSSRRFPRNLDATRYEKSFRISSLTSTDQLVIGILCQLLVDAL